MTARHKCYTAADNGNDATQVYAADDDATQMYTVADTEALTQVYAVSDNHKADAPTQLCHYRH